MKFVFVLFFSLAAAELPEYAYKMITQFKLNTNYMINWSLAESSHCKLATKGGYYGRYNIGVATLSDFRRLTRRGNEEIKDVPRYLEDDRNNCFIAYWLCSFYVRRLGFSYEEFFQIWLWGAYNVYQKKRYSRKYQKIITGCGTTAKLNMSLYWKYLPPPKKKESPGKTGKDKKGESE